MRLRHFDWILLFVMLALIGFGLLNVASTAYDSQVGLYKTYLKRQAIWAVLALGIFTCAQLVSYTKIERYTHLLYGLGLIALVVTMFMPPIKGARRWIRLGPIPFQPSEPMKLMLILMLARTLKYRDIGQRLSDLFPALLITGVPMFLIARQPDLSTAMTFLPVLAVMLYVGGARKAQFAQLALLALCILPFGLLLLKPYQRERLQTFFDRGKLSREQQLDQAYQSIQSEIAVGSGGVFGKGWRKGTQNQYGFIPDRHNDFIFSVIAEEWGFAGGLVLLAAYGLLLACCLGVVGSVREPFGQLVAAGVSTLIATQVVLHIAINLQIFPVTGLTLPLISCGGTSLVTCTLGLGLVSNIRLWYQPTL